MKQTKCASSKVVAIATKPGTFKSGRTILFPGSEGSHKMSVVRTSDFESLLTAQNKNVLLYISFVQW